MEEARHEIVATEDLIDLSYANAGQTRKVKVFRFPYGAQGFGSSWVSTWFRWCSPHYWKIQATLKGLGFSGPSHCFHDQLSPARLRLPYALYQNGYDWLWNWHTHDWTWSDLQPSHIDEDGKALVIQTKRSQRPAILLLHDKPTTPEGLERTIKSLAQQIHFLPIAG